MISVKSTGAAIAKGALPYLCRYLGVNAAFRAARSKSLLVLTYHSVVRDQHYSGVHSDYTVSLKTFREEMTMLARSCQPVSISDLADWWTGKADLPKHPVLVTFDDGYMNNLTNAAPVLLGLGIPALFNICTGYIESAQALWILEIYWRVLHWPNATIPTPGAGIDRTVDPQGRALLAGSVREACKKLPHEECERYLDRLREVEISDSREEKEEVFGFLDWDGVRRLKNKGFEIGSHTVEHPILTRISLDRVDHELRASKLAIEEQIGGVCRCFAYPNGSEPDISSAIAGRVQEAGYDFAFTTIGGFCSRNVNRFELGRICIPGNLSPSAFLNRISGCYSLVKQYVG